MPTHTLNGVNYTYTVGQSAASVAPSPTTLSGAVTIVSSFFLNSSVYTVTSIENFAFQNCTGIRAVSIQNGIVSIGDNAFQGSGLTSIAIPASVTGIGASAFQNCTSLTSITISSAVRTIGNSAFQGSGLTTIVIPTTVTTFGTSTLSGCTSLTSFDFGSRTTIPASTFLGCTSLTSVSVSSSVTDIGASAFQNCTGLTSIGIQTALRTIGANVFNGCIGLTSITIPSGVTTFGAGIFQGSGITSITIPSTVTSIGSSAFQNCTGLTTVTIQSSLTNIGISAFQNCTGLTSINIPSSVTSFGASAFQGCASLTSITVPTSVTGIGASAFNGCASLTSITVPTAVTSIGASAFLGCTLLTTCTTGSATSIGNNTFQNCTSLTTITISSSATSIGASAFQGCTSLATLTIPSLVTSIGISAFQSSGLTTLTIPTSVTTIGTSAFKDCTMLNTCTTGAATSIGTSTFQNCTSLTTITISSSATSIGTLAFNGCTSLSTLTIPSSVTIIGENAFKDCTSLSTVTIPSSVTTIQNYVFFGCTSLTSVTMPTSVISIGILVFSNCISLTTCGLGSVTSIAQGLFNNCSSLTSITIPANVTFINQGAFQNCTALTSVTIPTGVTTIPALTFKNCTSLTSITIPSVSSIESDAFYNCTRLTTIHFPRFLTSYHSTAFSLCTGLTSITVDAMNSMFSSVNGVLFNKNKNALMLYPPASTNTSYVIPSTVTTFGTSPFSQCANLTTITIPFSVQNIFNGIFINCNNLTTVIFTGFIPTIHPNNFTATNNTALYKSSINTDQTLALSKLTMFSSTNTWISEVSEPILSNFSIPTKIFGDANFTIIDPSSNSTGVFTYSSSNTAVANISGKTILIAGVGTSTIIAVQENTTTGATGAIAATMTVSKGTPAISFSVPAKTFGNAPFTVTPSSNSTGAFTYTSSNLSVATIAGNMVTIVGAGSSTITASQESTANYNSRSITATLTVNKASITYSGIFVPSTGQAKYGDAPFTITFTSNSTGAITYTSSNTAVATIAGNMITYVGLGTCNITMTQASDANYNLASFGGSITVSQGTPALIFSLPEKSYGDPAFQAGATSNSTGAITYTSSNTTIAQISGSEITIISPGGCTITATQAATANGLFSSATQNVSLVVNKAKPFIDFAAFGYFIPPRILNTATNYTTSFPSTNSNGLMTYSTSSISLISTGGSNGNVFRTWAAGVAIVTGSLQASTNYSAAVFDMPFAIETTTATITPTLSNFDALTKFFGDVFSLTQPTSTNTTINTFTYTTSDRSIATIVGNVVTIKGMGSCIIYATQSGDATYKSATITTTLTVGRGTTVLSNFSFPTTKTVGNVFTIVLNPGPTSGNVNEPTSNTGSSTFTYTSSNTAVATIAGVTVTIVGAGTSTITATQAATPNSTSGTISATLTVNQITPTIGVLSISAKTFGTAPFTITNPSSNSAGAFTYTSSDLAVATIVGNTVTILGVGSSTITATQASAGNYASGTTTATLTVSQGTPTISALSISAKAFGDAPFTITDPSSNSTGTFTYTSSNLAVATIAGKIMTIVGLGTSTITATQAATTNFVSGTITTSLTVSKGTPTIPNFSFANRIIGDAAFTITDPSSNSTGTFTYTSSNLAVATISEKTVTIIGRGTSTITATQASAGNFNSGTKTATLTVTNPLPTITELSISAKTIGNAPFTITDPSSNSAGLFTYTSSNLAVATIAGKTITIVGVGTSTITVTQASTTSYASGTTTATLTVNQITTVLQNFSVSTKKIGDADFQITDPSSNNAGLFTYTSSNTAVATIVGKTVSMVGAGTTTITATQAATTNYTSATITATFQVNPAQDAAVLTGFSVPTKRVGNAPFLITDPSSNSNGLFTYTSSNAAVATIVGKTITIVGAGTSTITANQESTLNYTSGTITATLTVTQGTLTLSNFSVPTKAIGDASFTITNPTSNSTGAFTYTSLNTSVATIVGNVVTIVGMGSSTITAVQASTPNYTSATITATFQVTNVLSTLSNFSIPAKTAGEAAFTIEPPSSNSTGAFTYTSSNLAVARITGSTITIFGAGTATITAVQAITAEFGSGSITASFTVNPITTVISSFDVSPRTFGAVPFKLRPVSNSNGAITYTSSDISLATIAGDMVTIVGVGSLTITASQASTNIYTSATSTATLTISPFTTVLSNFSVSAKTFGDASFSLPVPRTTGIGLITYASSNLSVATIAGNVVTIVGAGASTITATQESTPNYTSDSISATLQVSKVTTVLADFSIEPKAIGDEAFQITEPSTESDGLFTYTSSNATVATIVGDTITIVGTGTATITAVQSGTQNYTSATITAPLTVGKLSSILSNFSIEEKTFGNPSFKINPPSSTSNGIFTYTSSNTDVATIFIDSITIVGVGTSIITANQASNRNYLAGTTTATLTVNESTSSLSNFSIAAKTVGDAAFQLTAPRSTNLTGAFTYASSNTAVATIVGNTVTIVGAGTATITATQESTAEYASASITAPFTVNLLATTLSGFSVSPKTFGNAAFSLEPPTSNREGAFTYTSSNTQVATIAGSTVTIVGGGTATITASQASTSNYGAGTITDTLTVSRQTTVVSGFNVLPKAIGDAPFQLTPPTTNRLGDFTYSSSNTAVATIVGNTVTIVGVGTSIITAVQTITANFTTASITDFLNVGVRTTVLSNFSVSAKTIGDAPFQLTDPSSNSNGLFTYRSSNAAVATIDGNMVTVVGTGTATITATQASTSTSTSGTITAPLIVNKLSPTISLSLEKKTFGNPSFLINPSSNSSGIFTYSSSNTDVATIFRSSITIVGVGTSIITANQASTTNYLAGTTTATLIVNESTSSLSNFSITAKTVGDAAFQLTAPRSNNLTGAFTYTSSNTAVATIVGNTVTIVGAGTATITATQESTAEYASASITAPLTVNLLATTLSGFSVPPKQFGNAAFSLEPPTSNREGAFTYTSSNTQVATIDGSTVTIVGGGTATITATQTSTSNYGAGTITDTLTVSRQTTIVSTFSVEPKSFGDAPFQLTDPLTNRIGTFTYSSSNDAVATIVGNTVTIVGFGISTITAVQASTANFTTASITGVLNVGVRTTVLSNFSVSEKTIGDAPFQLTDPSSNSNGLFTYRSSNATVATIDGNMVTVVGTGTATITATQASTTTNTSATITAPLIVNKLSPILSNFSIEEKTFGNPSFKINPPSSTSNGIFTYISSNTDVATIFIDSITIVGVGTATITANQASNRNYLAGTTTATLTVNQATAVLSNFSIAARTLGDAAFQLAAPRRTGNGLITYASSNTAVATIVDNTVTIVGAGTATITATQESTAEYASASIDAPLTVNLLATTLSGFNVPPKTFGNTAFSLEPPTSTREGAFTYTSSNTDVATIDGSTVTIVGGGSSIITATQTSTTNYLAGTITSTLRVGSAATVLTNFSIPTKDTGNANFTITAPTTNSDCSFTYFSSNTSVATIDENTITIVGAGTTTIRAIQSSSEKYLSASITAPFVVNKGAPTITNFSIETKEIGSLDFKITDPTSNSPGAFTYATSNKAVAIVSGNTISVKAIGETIITATQTMTQNFIAGTITTKFIVNKRSPVITNFTLPEKTFGDIPFIITPGATTNSNGVITYTSSNLNVATISKNLITIIGGGTSIISFNQAATPVFASGIITTTLQVNKAIPFLYNFSIFQQLLGSPPFQIEPPMSDSDGAFTYESSNTSVATIAGSTITIVGAGTSTITAIQETTSKYASIPISTVFKVIRPNPQIGDLEITNKSLDTSSFTIVNPTKPPDSTGTWSYISSDTTKATIAGNLVTLLGAGIIIITGILTEDSLYNSATVFTQFAIAPRFVAPSIFPFTKSSALTNVIPRTYTPVSNTLTIPFNLFTTDLVSKLHPATLVRKKFVEIGTVIEKLANRNLIVNTLFDMYPIYTINVPSTSIYTISSINKKKISTLRLVKPTGTTLNNPLILNTVPSDITVAFVCLFTDYANGVRINGNGKNAPLYVEVTKANDNRYRVIRGNRLKKLMVSSIVMDGSIVVFAGITLLISSNVEN